MKKFALAAFILLFHTASLFAVEIVQFSTAGNPFSTLYPHGNLSGWWNELNGSREFGGSIYVTGFGYAFDIGGSNPTEYRGFQAYNLSSLSRRAVAARLRVIQGEMISPDNEEIVGVYDVDTPISELIQKDMPPNVDLFEDLGTGTLYGTQTISKFAPTSNILTIDLNNAVADINASRGGFFAIGFRSLSLDRVRNEYELFFGSTYQHPAILELEVVPEPASVVLLLLAALGMIPRRK
jgi:hypothetical protein